MIEGQESKREGSSKFDTETTNEAIETAARELEKSDSNFGTLEKFGQQV